MREREGDEGKEKGERDEDWTQGKREERAGERTAVEKNRGKWMERWRNEERARREKPHGKKRKRESPPDTEAP